VNFHPKANERGWRNHAESWMDEETFNKVKPVYDAYTAGTYKGNAIAAVAAILKEAIAAGKTGIPKAATASSEYWAWRTITVCRSMEWYEPPPPQPGTPPPADQVPQGFISTGVKAVEREQQRGQG